MRISFAEGNQKDIQGDLLELKGTNQGLGGPTCRCRATSANECGLSWIWGDEGTGMWGTGVAGGSVYV